MDRAIRQPYAGDSLAFAPPAASIDFAQPGDFANSRPYGEGLNAGNFTQNREAHRLIVSSSRDSVNAEGRHIFLMLKAPPIRSSG
jgi:hypothetical protein